MNVLALDDQIAISPAFDLDQLRRTTQRVTFIAIGELKENDVTLFLASGGTLLLKRCAAETIYPKSIGERVRYFPHVALDAGVKMVGEARILQLAEDATTALTF